MMVENRYRLQTAAPADAEFLYRVYASTREPEMALTGWVPKEIEKFLRWQYQLQQIQYRQNYPDASFDIIYIGDRPAGRLYVNHGAGEIRIIDISLLPEFRRQGTGTRILLDIIAHAQAAGLPVRLSVRYDNPARRLYQRLGFTDTGETEVYYFMERSVYITTPDNRVKI